MWVVRVFLLQVESVSRCITRLVRVGWAPEAVSKLAARRTVEGLAGVLSSAQFQWSPPVFTAAAHALSAIVDSKDRRQAAMVAGSLDACVSCIRNFSRYAIKRHQAPHGVLAFTRLSCGCVRVLPACPPCKSQHSTLPPLWSSSRRAR